MIRTYKRWIIGFSILFLIIVALVTSNQDMYFMVGLFFFLPFFSWLLGRISLRKVEAVRELPARAREGENIEIKIILRSHSKAPHFLLKIQDPLPSGMNPMDLSSPLLCIPASGEVSQVRTAELNRRGLFTFEWLGLSCSDPLGLFDFTTRIPLHSEILVYPQIYPLPYMQQSGDSSDGSFSRMRRFALLTGETPDGIREFTPGDSLRHIHWKSSARTGKLHVIEFEESVGHNLILALDLKQGSERGKEEHTTTEYMVHLAASIAHEAICLNAAVQLITSDEAQMSGIYGRGSKHLLYILEELAHAQANHSYSLSSFLGKALGSIPAHTSIYAFTSQYDSKLPELLSDYNCRGIESRIILIDPDSFQQGTTNPKEREEFLINCLSANVDLWSAEKCEDAHPIPWPYHAEKNLQYQHD
jgi:uncharacterized protein (DUF58 family)